MNDTKVCPRCRVDQSRSAFNKGRSECRVCSAAAHRAYYATTKGRATRLRRHRTAAYRTMDLARGRTPKRIVARRMNGVARLYGLTEHDYERLLTAQGGSCAVCRMLPTNKRLCVDHDHVTGDVRGLVCIGCNLLIYQLERDDETARRAREYLAAPPAKGVLEFDGPQLVKGA